ncbi:hypothetical protein E3N88_28670 [Mikania micrantha]|uniref:Uncharacterized protein n=1 Tax=Mikania micrantha TaxID=192012 RepID=A0A5N6N054_9ASTR|nr:hypothetical protein E3N88_28670 [Mikania micrantha]
MYVGTHTRPNSKGEQPCYLSTEETAVDFRVRKRLHATRPSYMYLTIGYVIAERLVFQSLYLWELVSAYMRYVKAKHKRNVTELLPGYKGHVIAKRLVFQSFCRLIRELLSAYRRYVIAKLCVCESMMFDKRDEKLTLTNTIDMKTLKQITKALMRIELIGRLDSGVCPIYKHTDLDITCGVNEVKVLPKEVKDRFKHKLLDLHTRLPR